MADTEKTDIGRLGEDIAVTFLKDKGYTILERNLIFRKKEIDIIADNGKCIIFIEVKTRTEGYLEPPAEAVTLKKQRCIIEAANDYIEKYGITKEIRLDIIAVVLNPDTSVSEIEHIENAFYPKVAKTK